MIKGIRTILILVGLSFFAQSGSGIKKART